MREATSGALGFWGCRYSRLGLGGGAGVHADRGRAGGGGAVWGGTRRAIRVSGGGGPGVIRAGQEEVAGRGGFEGGLLGAFSPDAGAQVTITRSGCTAAGRAWLVVRLLRRPAQGFKEWSLEGHFQAGAAVTCSDVHIGCGPVS